jgi:hypothetical protein
VLVHVAVRSRDKIKTTLRYAHPREHAVQKLFMRLGELERPEAGAECKKSVQNPVQSENNPRQTIRFDVGASCDDLHSV